METIKLNQDQYNELLGCGRLFFCKYNLWAINSKTYIDNIAVCYDLVDETYSLVKIEIK